jgi:NAD-dependent DNA ligase
MEDTKDEAHDVVQTELVADGIFRFTPVDSITFADKIFVLTGFGAEDEDRITDIIVKNGGIIKSSVVLKTNYLIVNSEYDHETAKYLKALELLEQGKNIAIISEQQFKTFS